MTTPILASDSATSYPATPTTFALPSINPAGANVVLYALISVDSASLITITPDAPGWSLKETNYADGTTTAIFRKEVPVYAGPYADTFHVGVGSVWGVVQFAFRSAGGAYPGNSNQDTDTFPCSTTPHSAVTTPHSPTAGSLVLGFVSIGGCGPPYTGTQTWSYDAGWTEIFDEESVAIGCAYRVANGTPGEATFGATRDQNKISSQVTFVLEDSLLEDPTEAVAIGWDIYAAADPNGAILATIDNFATARQLRAELNGTGSGSFSIARTAPIVTPEVLAKGNIVKCRIPAIGADYIGAFILERGDFKLVSANEEGDELLSFGGRGILAYLDRAVMWDQAYTTGLDISDTWTEIWEGSFTWQPVGTAFLAATPGYIYAIGRQTKRIYKIDQTTHKVVAYSPVLWSGSTKWAGGLSADPADANVMWALEAPWAGGYAGNTKIRKIDISGSIGSWNVSATHDLGSAVQLSAIKADSSVLWCSRYDSTASIQKRSKTTGGLTTAYTISYGGVTQTKAVGVSVNGSNLAYWFSGTKRALIAASSAPATVTGKISTQSISAFGGDWTTESSQDYFYMDSYTAGRVWKYQITAATPHDPVDGIWRLDEGTPGAILWRLMQEWQAAGRPQQPLPDATYVFTSADDSPGNAWATHDGTLEYDARIGDSGVETVLRLIPYGLTVQMAPDLELGGYNSFGSNKAGASFGAGIVRFAAGHNIVDELTRRLDERQADSHLLVGGDGSTFVEAIEDDLGYVREGFLSTNLQAAAAMTGTGEAELERQRDAADSVAFAVLFGDDEAGGVYLPGPSGSNGHYWLGDTVRIHTGAGSVDFDEQDLRVYAVTLEEQSNGAWRPVVELTSPFLLEPNVGSSGSASGSSSGTSIGGTGTSGSTGSGAATLKVTDGADISIPGVTTIQAQGVYSPSPGLAVIPIPDTSPPLLEELLTDETDATKVPHPDGAGGVAWGDDETGGGASNNVVRALSLILPPWIRGTGTLDVRLHPAGEITVDAGASYKSFMGLTYLDGILYLIYRDGSAHNSAGGSIKLTTATLLGALTGSWTTAVALVTATGSNDVRDPFIKALSTGRILWGYDTRNPYSSSNIVAYTSYTDDRFQTTAVAVAISASFSGSSIVTAPPIELPDGRVVLPGFGDNGGLYDAVVWVSADHGATYPDEHTIASGTRDWEEPVIGLLSTGELVAMVRSSTTSSTWRSVCVDWDDGTFTFSSPTAVVTAGGRPDWKELLPGLAVMFCRTDNASTFDPRWTYSTDKLATWAALAELVPGVTTDLEYSAIEVLAPGIAMGVYSRENGSGDADLFLQLVVAGYGLDPFGDAWFRRLNLDEQAEPSSPPSGKGVVYFGTDSHPHAKADDGTDYDLTEGSAGGSASYREVLMQTGITSPPDPLISTDGTDWLYGVPA